MTAQLHNRLDVAWRAALCVLILGVALLLMDGSLNPTDGAAINAALGLHPVVVTPITGQTVKQLYLQDSR